MFEYKERPVEELISEYTTGLLVLVELLENYRQSAYTGKELGTPARKLRAIAMRKFQRGGTPEELLRQAMQDAEDVVFDLYGDCGGYEPLVKNPERLTLMVDEEVIRLSKTLPGLGVRWIFDKYDRERTVKAFNTVANAHTINPSKIYASVLALVVPLVGEVGYKDLHSEMVIVSQELSAHRPNRGKWHGTHLQHAYSAGMRPQEIEWAVDKYWRALVDMEYFVNKVFAAMGVVCQNDMVLLDKTQSTYKTWLHPELDRMELLYVELIFRKIEAAL